MNELLYLNVGVFSLTFDKKNYSSKEDAIF